MKELIEAVEQLTDCSKYDEATQLVANSFGLSFKAEFLENNYHFSNDNHKRDIYKITLSRGSRKYSFKFGNSIVDSQYYEDNKTGRRYSMCGKGLDGNYNYRPEYLANNVGKYALFTIKQGTPPSLYSVLACLQKYDVGTFENFCGDFGYDTDSRSAKKTYKAVAKEYDKMCGLFNDEELEVLSYIS